MHSPLSSGGDRSGYQRLSSFYIYYLGNVYIMTEFYCVTENLVFNGYILMKLKFRATQMSEDKL